MEESWKDISGYEGRYQISNMGRVKSLKRKILDKDNYTRTSKEKILAKRLDTKGYPCVMLYDGTRKSKGKSHKVHRLVANAFIPNPNSLPQVNHKDLNKENNNVSNLEWVTQKENMRHAIEHGAITFTPTVHSLETIKKIKSKLKHISRPVVQLDLDGNFIAEYESESEASIAIFGHTKSHIWECCKGLRNQCGGYKWQYKCDDCDFYCEGCDLCY